MKFLNVYCQKRVATVYINIEKIVMITPAGDEERSSIEIEGISDNRGPVEVAMKAPELVRLINGEDKTRIGFRTGG